MSKIGNNYAQFHRRVGKHSLTGDGSGRLISMPAGASDLRIMYKNANEQYLALSEEYETSKNKINDLQKRLSGIIPSDKREALYRERQELLPRYQKIQGELHKLNEMRKAISSEDFDAAFYYLARALFPREVFAELENLTKEEVGHHRIEQGALLRRWKRQGVL